MKLSFQTAGPAGDLTILVHTAVPQEEREALAQRLMALPELEASRVYFLLPPAGDGVIRLEAPHGVFSGNALAFGALSFAAARGVRREKKLPVEMAGLEQACTVHVNPLAGHATVDLPLPLGAEKVPFLGQTVPVVVFPGIVHALWQEGALPEDGTLLPALQALAQSWDCPAAGVMGWNFRTQAMTPVLWLPGESALRHRPTCSSGAAAAAAWSALRGGQGHRKLDVRQPGGVVQTAAVGQPGALRRLTASFPVSLGPTYELTF